MKVRKIIYRKKNDLTASLALMDVGTPRIVPHDDYTFAVVRTTIGRIEKMCEKRYEFYDVETGTIVRRIN